MLSVRMDQTEQPDCSAAADILTLYERSYVNDSCQLSEEVGTVTNGFPASSNSKILMWLVRM